MRSEVGMVRQRKLKCHNGSEVNAMAAKTSVKTLLPSLHGEASGLHNSWNSWSILRKCIRDDLRRPEIQTFLGGMPLDTPCGCARRAFMRLTYCSKPPPVNFCLRP